MHWKPTRLVIAPIATPRIEASPPSEAEDRSAAVVVDWQHCVGPVEQVLPEPPSGVGVATARVARAAAMKASLNCMMMMDRRS